MRWGWYEVLEFENSLSLSLSHTQWPWTGLRCAWLTQLVWNNLMWLVELVRLFIQMWKMLSSFCWFCTIWELRQLPDTFIPLHMHVSCWSISCMRSHEIGSLELQFWCQYLNYLNFLFIWNVLGSGLECIDWTPDWQDVCRAIKCYYCQVFELHKWTVSWSCRCSPFSCCFSNERSERVST